MAEADKSALSAIMRGPRCGAKTRSGGACQAPAANGYRRCRMHGGAPGSGAPRGNKNAIRHGFYTAEAKSLRHHTRKLLHAMHIVTEMIEQPSEEMQLWASIYLLENQHNLLPEGEIDQIATFVRNRLRLMSKWEAAKKRLAGGKGARSKKSEPRRQKAKKKG